MFRGFRAVSAGFGAPELSDYLRGTEPALTPAEPMEPKQFSCAQQ
jgi:hypothetical protein